MAAPGSWKGTFETWELQVGDLCIFTGDEKFSLLRHHLIYQVSQKEVNVGSTYSIHRYSYRVAFDVTNPTGSSVDETTALGTRGLRKITLLDLCTVRLHFDDFIRQYAQQCGAEVSAVQAIAGQPSEALADPVEDSDLRST